jgi:hypothetical protein
MGAARIADADEASETISEDRARGVEIAPRQGLDLSAAEPIDTAQLETDGFSSRGRLDRGDDRGLAGGAPAPLTTVAFAADLSVINLDPTGQALAGVPLHHHLHQLVLDLPGRGLGHAEAAAQLDASDAPLLWVKWYIALNQRRSPTLVEAKMVPAMSDVCRRQAAH